MVVFPTPGVPVTRMAFVKVPLPSYFLGSVNLCSAVLSKFVVLLYCMQYSSGCCLLAFLG
jgi:hypothetical protein